MSATSDRNNASDTMSPPNDSSTHTKRKSEDAAPQPRAKRNRYISIAWYGSDECSMWPRELMELQQ